MARLLAEHEGILDSIRQGFTGQAVDRMRQHLRQVLTTLSDLIDANREYFDDTEG
jgi:DNA-binding GntR family transcriptional regulator